MAATKKLEETLAKLLAAVTVVRAKEPPDQQPVVTSTRGWSFLPSVTQAPLGLVPKALPHLRLEPPRFDGENAQDWIHRIQKYYNHHYTPLDDRLYLTKYLFDQPASDWMEYWEENNKGKGWDDFLLAVKQRFDPDLYDDYIGRLVTLRQTSTVEAYQTSFEALLPKASHVGESMLSYLFIAGLKSPLKQVVLMRRPSSLRDTFVIAQRLQACHAMTASPGPFPRMDWTSRDQQQPNRTTAKPVANWKPNRPPPQQSEEVTQVIVDNEFGARPLNAESSNIFANGSSSNSIVCDGNMNQNMGSANYGVSNELGFDTMDAIRDVDPFLGFGSPNSYSGWSVDAELPLPNCNRGDGKFQVEARHIRGVSGEAMGVPVVSDEQQTDTVPVLTISGPVSFHTDSTTWVAGMKQATTVPVVTFQKPLLNFTFPNLLSATSNFDRDTLLAEESFEPVYHGVFLEGICVDVKVSFQMKMKGHNDFELMLLIAILTSTLRARWISTVGELIGTWTLIRVSCFQVHQSAAIHSSMPSLAAAARSLHKPNPSRKQNLDAKSAAQEGR